jgi:hypothetical protein
VERHHRPALGAPRSTSKRSVAADQVAIAAGFDPNRFDGTVVEKWTDRSG